VGLGCQLGWGMVEWGGIWVGYSCRWGEDGLGGWGVTAELGGVRLKAGLRHGWGECLA